MNIKFNQMINLMIIFNKIKLYNINLNKIDI